MYSSEFQLGNAQQESEDIQDEEQTRNKRKEPGRRIT